jgi:nitroimidazol reductase NimA-like FMN-containing flavoprotein (pyridoxamine 5'-phosphate oxidase superfamily)
MTDDTAAIARAIIDANSYMVLGTSDEAGLPWVSPVWFATADYQEFFWVSDPGRRHSWNLAVRPQLSIVIFDSTVAPNTGQAVYMSAVAEQLEGAELEAGLRVFAEHSAARGLSVWGPEHVRAPARHRLYRATVSEHFVLRADRDVRVAVTP